MAKSPLRTQLQTVALVVVLVGLVAGITFIAQWQTLRPRDESRSKPAAGPAIQLVFTAGTGKGPECEVHQSGSYCFWFQNPNDRPVKLVEKAHNDVCADVRIGLVPWDGWKDWPGWALALSSSQGLVAPGRSLDPLGPAFGALLEGRVHWQRLEPGQSLTVPKADPQTGPAAGVIRLGWDGSKLGGQSLKVDLEEEGGPRFTLQVPLVVLPAVLANPPTAELPKDLWAGNPDPQTAQFVCWSSTRPAFRLAAAESTGDPCFVCDAAPLTGPELEAVGQSGGPRARSGYRVHVTVYEQRGQKPLDLGPFLRRIDLKIDGEPERYSVEVAGVVRGDIALVAGDEKDKDRINLGQFLASRGTKKTVALESTQPGVGLAVESKSPEYLQVELGEPRQAFGRTQWDMTVTVPPQRASGLLPADGAVNLKLKGKSARGLRIPVAGNAIVR
jgi:hypothetical protein